MIPDLTGYTNTPFPQLRREEELAIYARPSPDWPMLGTVSTFTQ